MGEKYQCNSKLESNKDFLRFAKIQGSKNTVFKEIAKRSLAFI